MAMMLLSIFGLLLMLLLIVLLLLWACKPWRFFSRYRSIKVGDLEKPLVSEDSIHIENGRDNLGRNIDLEGSYIRDEGTFSSPRAQGIVCKQRLPSGDAHVIQVSGASFVPDGISDPIEDFHVGQTLKRPLGRNLSVEEQKYARREGSKNELSFDDGTRIAMPEYLAHQRSRLTLEVMSGPSHGLHYSIQSTDTSKLPVTLGRVSPSDLLLKDVEVSGKHARITWNLNNLKWELTDMGSLNGTLLNSQPIHHPDIGRRHWSEPIELTNGDMITLGTISHILVQITPADFQIPFGVGVASDPMAMRRGGKKLPMEDVCYYLWPLPGVEQFGLFGICDGHGGDGAAKAASKMLPEVIGSILSVPEKRERVLSKSDATDVLRDAFFQTDAALHHEYEGCTATVLLVWVDHEELCAQCANVGDSACVMNISGKQVNLTEDHRVTSQSERMRMKGMGQPLRDGEKRLHGLNLARALGDKFLKEQDARFSSEPYISEVVHIKKESTAFAVLASDGLWDVISTKKAVQLVLQTKERYAGDRGNTAEKIANFILSEANNLRTKDNTSIIFLDFDTSVRTGFCKVA